MCLEVTTFHGSLYFISVPNSPGGVAHGREPHVPDWVRFCLNEPISMLTSCYSIIMFLQTTDFCLEHVKTDS